MQTSATPAKPAPARLLQNLQRRLERWELEHLRRHAAELAERLERAEEDAQRERECAEAWWQTAMDLQQELMAEGKQLGLTIDGQLGVLAEDPVVAQRDALLDAARAAEAIFARQKWRDDSNDPEAVALRKLRAAIAAATTPAGE